MLRLTPFKISIIYVFVGGSWLFFGDKLIPVLSSSPIISTALHVLTDSLFIIISASMLYFMTYYSEKALIKNAASLANAQRIAKLGNWDWDIVNNSLYWSDETYRIFGLTPQEFEATFEAFLKYVNPDDREFVQISVDEALHEKKPYAIDHRIVLPNGDTRIVHEHGEVVRDENGRPLRMTGTVQDVTDHKEAEAELKKLSAAIDHSVNVIFITNVKGSIEYVNPMFEEVTGWSKEEAIGQNPRILSSGETTKAEYEELWKTIASGTTWRGIFKNKKKSGEFYWGNGVITPIKNDKGETTHFLAVQEDITERKESEERAQYLAYYDDMTGLTNRARFMEMLSEWFYCQTSSEGITGVLLLIDIDGFKFINDTYGHGVGDELLRRIAVVFKNGIKGIVFPSSKGQKEAYLGRMGGDEFAVFLPYLNAREGFEVAEKLRKMVEEFDLLEGTAHATVSVGLAVYPEHGMTSKELFTKVDAAKNRAKDNGRNRSHIYRPEDKDLENMHLRLKEKEQILKAMKDDSFFPWYQPIMNLKSGKVHHYEALARMRREDGKILFPNEFIDAAERFGLIGGIDRIVTEKTMKLQAEMGRQGRYISYAMNLSGKNLGDEKLLSFLQSRIEETGADPNYLVFEITETAAVQDLDRAIKFIKSLKSMGCHFSLDDFGVGFTSFVYLREMGVDYLKIDGSFVKKLSESANDRLFVKAITDVAKGIGIATIAEFVENEKIVDILKELGVDYAQGYYIGKPGPELLKDR